MPRYTPESKEQVRDAVDMIDLVGTRTELRRAGGNRFTGLCPFHEERSPSFGIDPQQKVYHCFGCGVGGDAFTFVQELEGIDFTGALEYLADRYNVQLEVLDENPEQAARRKRRSRLVELLERTSAFYERMLWESDEAAPAREYLAARGLTEESLRTFRVGYAPSAWDRVLTASRRSGFSEAELAAAGLVSRSEKAGGRVYDRFRRRIMFPLADRRGEILGFGGRRMSEEQQPKYVNTAETELFTKGRHVYGAQHARSAAAKAGVVILAEGYTDVIALHQAGLVNTVGLMGTALTPEQVSELAQMAKVVALALDADSAGQEAMIRAARVARGKDLELRVIPLPDGADPADLVAQRGGDAMRDLAAASVPFVTFQVRRELIRGDSSSAEGKDRVIAALRPVFDVRTLPPGAQREELLSTVAEYLDLAPSLVSSWLSASQPRQPDSEVARPAAPPEAVGRALTKLEVQEMSLLAMCLELPEEGARFLSLLDIETAFTGELRQAVARRLRDNPGVPIESGGELGPVLAELAVKAAGDEVTPAKLELEYWQLRLSLHDRKVDALRRRGESIGALADDRMKLMDEIDRAMLAAMEESAPPVG